MTGPWVYSVYTLYGRSCFIRHEAKTKQGHIDSHTFVVLTAGSGATVSTGGRSDAKRFWLSSRSFLTDAVGVVVPRLPKIELKPGDDGSAGVTIPARAADQRRPQNIRAFALLQLRRLFRRSSYPAAVATTTKYLAMQNTMQQQISHGSKTMSSCTMYILGIYIRSRSPIVHKLHTWSV